MSDPVTIQEIAKSTGLVERSVLRWLRRLSILPFSMRGKLHLYRAETVAVIQAGMMEAETARKEAIRASKARPKIISVKEARRRAGKGARG